MKKRKREEKKYKLNQCIETLKAKGVDTVTGVDPAPNNMGLWKYSIKQKKVLGSIVVSLYDFIVFDGKRPRCSMIGAAMKLFLENYSHFFDADAIVVEQQIQPSAHINGISSSTYNVIIESIILHNFPDKTVIVTPQEVYKYIKTMFHIEESKYNRAEKKKLYANLSKKLMTPEEKVLLRRAVAHKKSTMKRGKTSKTSMVDIADAKFIVCYFIEKIIEAQNMIEWYSQVTVTNKKALKQPSITDYIATPKKKKKPPPKKKRSTKKKPTTTTTTTILYVEE
jgi:hypothetical protein